MSDNPLNRLGDAIATIVAGNPYAALIFAIVFWLLIVRPILATRRSGERAQAPVPDLGSDAEDAGADNDSYVLTQDDYESLVARTFVAWRDSEIDGCFSEASSTATDTGAIHRMFDKTLDVLSVAYNDKPPEDGEYLVATLNGGVRTSYILTNRYFVFFSLDKSAAAHDYEEARIAVSDVVRLENSRKWGMNNLTIELASGRSVIVRDLLDDHPLRYLQYRLDSAAVID